MQSDQLPILRGAIEEEVHDLSSLVPADEIGAFFQHAADVSLETINSHDSKFPPKAATVADWLINCAIESSQPGSCWSTEFFSMVSATSIRP